MLGRMPLIDQTKPLWACPRCGHRFITPNSWHSCTQFQLDRHFEGRDARLRELFDAWLAFVQKHGGPLTVIPQKTRISFQARLRFSGAVIRRNWVECALWLKREVKDARFDRVQKIPPHNYIYYFHLTDPSQLDKGMKAYVKEAYAAGMQKV